MTSGGEIALGQAAVTVIDNVSPALNVTGGSIHAGGWHRQAADIRFDATDNVGIREATLAVGGVEKARRDFSCDFTKPAPCSNQLAQTLSFDTSGLTEGSHTARLTVVDAAGNATHYDRTLKVDRTAPILQLDGSLKPEGHSWVARGEQDLAIDALDPVSGAVEVTWQVFGVPGVQQQACPQGGCDLFADVLVDTTPKAAGAHTVVATATDAAGNTATQSWTIKLERTPPTLALSGTLNAAAGQTLGAGQTYTLTASAADGSTTAPQSGLGRLEFMVDDEAPTVVEQACAPGACSLSHSFTYRVDDYDDGDHTITVVATDIAGNQVIRSLQVGNPQGSTPGCLAPPAPTTTTPSVASMAPQAALDGFRARLPQAFARWTPVDFGEVVVQPKLDGSSATAFQSTSSVAPMSVDKQISDGATTTVRTDESPICVTPRIVSTKASAPTAVIDETSTLYANSAAATDTLYKPSVAGTEILGQLRQGVAPLTFSWHVHLEPGEVLKQLPDGTIAVVEPVPAGSAIVTEGVAPPPVPSTAARKDALSDTRLHVDQAIGAFDRALGATPDEVVAVIPKPWAVDALDRPIATSLSVSGSTVSVQISHNVAGTAYPVVTGVQLLVGDALDEWVAMEADANRALRMATVWHSTRQS